jgi:hypothetical protein
MSHLENGPPTSTLHPGSWFSYSTVSSIAMLLHKPAGARERVGPLLPHEAAKRVYLLAWP